MQTLGFNADETSPRPRIFSTLKIDQLDWLKSYTSKIDEANRATVDLLESSWLQLDLDNDTMEDERRASELARIRHIFIPELIFRLHALLFSSREIVPGCVRSKLSPLSPSHPSLFAHVHFVSSCTHSNLQKVLELPNLVASETHKLYVEFIEASRNRLPAYLALVRQTTLECLVDADLAKGVKGNQDPFRVGA